MNTTARTPVNPTTPTTPTGDDALSRYDAELRRLRAQRLDRFAAGPSTELIWVRVRVVSGV